MIHRSSVSPSRRRQAYLLVAVGLPLLTLALVPFRDDVDLGTDMLALLLLVVVVALVGGRAPALVAAVAASLVLNLFFTPPFNELAIADAGNVTNLVAFVLVAVLVSWAVDVAASRTEQAAAAGAAARLRSALLVAVGHDLRAPLAVAKAGVSGARSDHAGLSDADRAELLASADLALDRLAGLVDDLLDLSRVQTGAMAVRVVPTAVDDVVVRALDDLGVAPRGVVLEVGDDLPLVLADPALLERVLANLVANAQCYSAPGSHPVVRTAVVGDRVEVQVVDRGPGIPAADRERVFQPFQRLGDTDTGGLGLGLALARGLTEAMLGTVEARDTDGGGLTMVVSLVAAPAAAETP